jgi:FixJ family two-component response regulator
MDGIEVIIALSEKMPGLPVIAISGGGKVPKELLLVSANLLGAVTTLSKPFEVAELIAAVELALASRRREGDSTG